MDFFRKDDFLTKALEGEAYWLAELPTEAVAKAFEAESANLLSASSSFATAKVNAADVTTLRLLEGEGFRLVDTNITLVKAASGHPCTQDESHIRSAKKNDEQAVCRIAARNLTTSRFHLDPYIDNSVAATIKAQWAGNFFNDSRGDHMIIAETDGECVGFLQLLETDAALIIDLVAVDKASRQRGLGRAMITFAEQEHGKGKQIFVGTQAANTTSLRFYQSLGFVFAGAKYVLHAHGGSQCL